MEKTHQLPITVMIKERRLRWRGHAARRSGNNKKLLFATRIPGHVQPVGWPCGTWMHYAMWDEGCEGHETANGLLQPRMELDESSHEHTYWGIDGAKLY